MRSRAIRPTTTATRPLVVIAYPASAKRHAPSRATNMTFRRTNPADSRTAICPARAFRRAVFHRTTTNMASKHALARGSHVRVAGGPTQSPSRNAYLSDSSKRSATIVAVIATTLVAAGRCPRTDPASSDTTLASARNGYRVDATGSTRGKPAPCSPLRLQRGWCMRLR